jgi:hypothetical protein
MGRTRPVQSASKSSSIAGLLAWIFPGLGHWYLGHRARAIIITVVIAITFWTGVAIGGVKSTIDPQENRIWFLAQVCAGTHTIVAAIWSGQLESVGYSCPHCKAVLPRRPSDDTPCPRCGRRVAGFEALTHTRLAFWPQVDIAVVYTGLAGLLNVLVILDAIARAELEPLQRAARQAAGGAGHG